MIKPPVLDNESDRLACLMRLDILDTAAEPDFDAVTSLASRMFNAPISLISLVDESRQWFKSKVGLDVCETHRDYSFCAHAIDQGELLIVPDTYKEERFFDNPLVTGPPFIRFYAGAPLMTPAGLGLGTICVIDTAPRHGFSQTDQQALRQLARIVMNKIELNQSLGYVDPVTQLPNRRRMADVIDGQLIESRNDVNSLTVLAIDMAEARRFADLIQTLGHAYSDAFILTSARILEEILPEGLKLFHLGLFRFAVLLPADSLMDEQRLTERLVERLEQPIQCGPVPLDLSPALGIARHPEDGRNGVELMRAAVTAIHSARRSRSMSKRYDVALDESYKRAFRLMSDLRTALDEGNQFELWFQPKIDLKTGKCAGAEALIRWSHPEMGNIPPGEFIALAERTELMPRITEWVLSAGMHQLGEWAKEGVDISLSVNVSVVDVADRHFATMLQMMLQRYELRPELLELEITESAIMSDLATTQSQLETIKKMGVRIAVDDFGTGYSSFSYMKHIPLDTVKIDQIFVRSLMSDRDDQIIVRAMVRLAEEFGLQLIAEGIESENARQWLSENGCRFGQGYLFSRPLPSGDFRNWLMNN